MNDDYYALGLEKRYEMSFGDKRGSCGLYTEKTKPSGSF